MKKYSFIDLTKEFKDYKIYENVYCYYWEKENNKWIRKYDKFENKDYYFYVDISERPKLNEMRDIKIYPKEFITIEGKKCIKIEPIKKLKTSEFKELRERFTQTYEADIPALTRWIANNKPKYTKQVRKLYIDIETIKINNQYSKPEDANAPIIMITCYDNFTEEYTTFAYKHFESKHNKIICPSEGKMLEEFIKYIRIINPDYILGWNIESYDIPYILNRLQKINLNYHAVSNLNYITFRQTQEVSAHKFSSFYINIRGMGVFDLMSASQRLWLGKYCGYSLDKMSEHYLKKNKIEVDDIDELYEKDINKLAEYNIQDVRLCIELDNKLELFKKFQSFQDIISINVHNSLIQSGNIIQYLLQHSNRILLNSNYKADSKTFEGGYVLDSIPGIYKDCLKYDFVSMYPSILITYNISPDTILLNKEEDCINMNDKYYFKQEKGIITKVVEELYEKRVQYKKENNKDLSLVYKLLMNSIYGQFTAPYSRLYSFYCGKAITHQGRRIIKNLVEEVKNNLNGKVILGDTDSIVFYPSKTIDKKIIIDIFEDIIKKIYKKDNIKGNKLIELELEKKINKLIIFGNKNKTIKKKYIESNGPEKRYVGLDAIKSDTPELAKFLQMELVDYFLAEEKVKRKDIEIIIKKYYDKFLDYISNKNYKMVAIPAKINKPLDLYKKLTFSTRAIKNSGLEVGMNDRFYILITKDGPYAFKNKSEIKKNLILDKDYMWDRIKRKTDIFLDLLPSIQQTL